MTVGRVDTEVGVDRLVAAAVVVVAAAADVVAADVVAVVVVAVVAVVVAAAVVEALAYLGNRLHKQDEKNGTHFVANPISSPDLSQ
jgi:opacity protein-like surface antigen